MAKQALRDGIEYSGVRVQELEPIPLAAFEKIAPYSSLGMDGLWLGADVGSTMHGPRYRLAFNPASMALNAFPVRWATGIRFAWTAAQWVYALNPTSSPDEAHALLEAVELPWCYFVSCLGAQDIPRINDDWQFGIMFQTPNWPPLQLRLPVFGDELAQRYPW